MKPGFALSLSFDGISLLQRAAGGWRSVGTVRPDAPDLARELSVLRDKALALKSGDLRCKIVIPNDQVRYLTVQTGTFGGDARMAVVQSALDGATPYPVEDLVFDISVDGENTHVAAVARETLSEAEAFALEHGFNPVSFVAAPGDNDFLGEPFFGTSVHAATLDANDPVERDGIAVVVIGPAEPAPVTQDLPPESPEKVLAKTQTGPESATTPAPEADTPKTGFSSRRVKSKIPPPPDPATPPQTKPKTLGGAQRQAPAPAAQKPAPAATRTTADEPLSEVAPEPTAPPEPEFEPDATSVTAPGLDFDDPADAPPPAPQNALAKSVTGFLSRRKNPARGKPTPPKPPADNQAGGTSREVPTPPPVSAPSPNPAAAPIAVAGPVAASGFASGEVVTTDEEAERLTVFGARDDARIGGKPRHLGLILTAVLLLVLAAVAAWAALFLEDGVAGLFKSAPDAPVVVAVPGTPTIGGIAAAPTGDTSAAPDAQAGLNAESPSSGDSLPDAGGPDVADASRPLIEEPDQIAALPSPNTTDDPTETPGAAPQAARNDPADLPDTPETPGLTDTDSAVLDALGQPMADEESEQDLPAPTVLATPDNTAEQDPITADARYAATGIWQRAPRVPDTPSIIGLDDLYVASIDSTDLFHDAVALPSQATINTDRSPATQSSPVSAGTRIDLGADGLVAATPEGAVNPDGVVVYLGRPPVVPPAVPDRAEQQTETETPLDRLAGKRPRARPTDLAERFERSNLGGLTRDELAGVRPKARPPLTAKQKAELDETPTAQAVVVSRIPSGRPRGFEAIVKKARRNAPQTAPASAPGSQPAATAVATVAPRTVTPRIPSSASVARQATLNNAINLRQVNLIGVYGTPSNRRALVRLASGRYKKVKIGDTVDGGRVVAIGDSELRYQKGGRNLTLKIPKG